MADIQHNAIADPNIHEPKGVAAANSGTVYVSDGAGSGSWTQASVAAFPRTSTPWADHFIPAQGGFYLPAAAATQDTVDGSILLDAAAKESIFTSFVLPRGILSTTELNFYAYWGKTTSATGDVAFEIAWKIAAPGSVISGTWTSLAVETTPDTTDNDTADEVQVTNMGLLDITTLDYADLLLLRVSRDGADVGDTYGADVNFYGLGLTFKRDEIGNTTEWP